MIHFHNAIAALTLAGFATLPPAVWAGALDTDSSTGAPAARPAFGRVVDSGRLGDMRGGLDTSNKNSLDGTVSDNRASHITTGANSIADGSFANAVGLPTVIQNSGANVLIQNSTIVNVHLR